MYKINVYAYVKVCTSLTGTCKSSTVQTMGVDKMLTPGPWTRITISLS